MALAPSTDLTKSRGLRAEEEMTWAFLEKSGSGAVGSMNLIKAGDQIRKLFPDTAEVYVLLFGSRCVLDPRAAHFPSWAVTRAGHESFKDFHLSHRMSQMTA